MNVKQGDFVVRQSYGGDVIFRIVAIRTEYAILKGLDFRLLADAPLDDLEIVENPFETIISQSVRIKVNETIQKIHAEIEQQPQDLSQAFSLRSLPDQSYFAMPGKVLHLDGDANYLKKSIQLYDTMRVPSEGFFLNEARMAEALFHLLPEIKPDIVVITGHDGVLKQREGFEMDLSSLSSYKNSQHFVNAVRIAREYDKNRDNLIIVAGACQSHYEALLRAGSNFASSPGRILIHALDPVYIAIKASYTPIKEIINLPEVVSGTISGIDGVGGIETIGKYRVGYPKSKHSSTVFN